MKILALNFNQKGIGTWRRSFYFSRELARAGHDVSLATVSRSSRFRRLISFKRDWIGEVQSPEGPGPWIRVIEGPAWGYRLLPGWGSGPLDIWGRTDEILRGDFDAVIGFEYHPNVSWPVYLTRLRRRYIFVSDWCDWFAGTSNEFRGWLLAQRIDRYLEEKIRTHAERVSVTSHVLFDRALSIGVPRSRVVQIPEGAATDYILPACSKEMRERFRLPLDVPIVLQVRNGDMCREVRIFREVLRRVSSTYLLLLGNPSIPALKLAEHLGISDRILCTGWVSDQEYPAYLACADVCMSPLNDNLDDRARWPAKILDFLAAGRATITNAVGEAGNLFRDSGVGVLAGHADEEFAAEVVALLKDSDRRRSLGDLARRVMVEGWDWCLRRPQINSLFC